MTIRRLHAAAVMGPYQGPCLLFLPLHCSKARVHVHACRPAQLQTERSSCSPQPWRWQPVPAAMPQDKGWVPASAPEHASMQQSGPDA